MARDGGGRALVARALGHDKLNRLVAKTRSGARHDRYAALAALRARAPAGYLDPLAASEARVFSQNGEDGVLAEIFARVGVGARRFVEFGIQEGREGNAVLLADVGRWSGLFAEPDPAAFAALLSKYRHSDRVRVERVAITPDNLDPLLRRAGLFEDLDLLSIDVDGADYWIWRGTAVRPRVVVIEHNAALGLESLVEPWDPARRWDGTDATGASLPALHRLGRAKGYALVHVELAGVNAFFVREDLTEGTGLEALSPEAAYRAPNFGLEGRRHPPGGVLDWVRVGEDGEPVPPPSTAS